jgi:hypothetical protein
MEMKYSKATDTEHKIKLESSLVYAVWRAGVARAGGKTGFEIGTAFVGNGASVKAKGKSEGGKSLGTVKGKIRSNKFVGEFDIPEDIELDDAVYFEAELSQLGLSDESNRIPTAPAVEISDMKWSAEEARRGDILKLTATVDGCDDETEAIVTIYEYDDDGVHDKITELPAKVMENKIELEWEYEYHEDTDEVPSDEELKKYGKSYNPPEYFFVIEIDGQKFGQEQESKLLTFKDYVEVHLEDENNQPMENQDFKLYLPDGTEKDGTTDEGGYARIDGVPPGPYTIGFPNLGKSSDTSKGTEKVKTDSESSSASGAGSGSQSSADEDSDEE